MQRTTKIVMGGVAALALAAATAGIAVASGGGDSDTPITGPDFDKATAAALAHTGGGRVTGTEVGDEESYYEVEVTLDDGTQVDVQLDKGFNVVSQSSDSDSVEDDDADD